MTAPCFPCSYTGLEALEVCVQLLFALDPTPRNKCVIFVGPTKIPVHQKGKGWQLRKAGGGKPRKLFPAQKTVQQFVLRTHICFFPHLVISAGIKVAALQTRPDSLGRDHANSSKQYLGPREMQNICKEIFLAKFLQFGDYRTQAFGLQSK